MNVGDSEIVVSIMQNEGWRYTDDPREADVILINTCSIRDNAEQRVLGRLREFKPYKRRKKALLVGVIGNFIMGVFCSRLMIKSLSGFKPLRKKWLFGGADK